MSSKKNYTWPIISCVVALLLVLVALPQSAKQWAPSFLRSPSLHFGLDLAGGTQLDFRISEQELNDQIAKTTEAIKTGDASKKESLELQLNALHEQKRTLVEAIRTVLERRINSLGVSEAVITPSIIGNEKHLLVECPGVVDVQSCIATVGKTIQLEFKEEFTEPTTEFISESENKATAALKRITESGTSLEIVAQDLSSDIDVFYVPQRSFFQDQLHIGLEDIWDRTPEQGIYRVNGTIVVNGTAQDGSQAPQEVPGIFLAQVLEPRTETGRTIDQAPVAFTLLDEREEDASYIVHNGEQLSNDLGDTISSKLRSMQAGELETIQNADGTASILFLQSLAPGTEKTAASHILIAYKGAFSAVETVSRSKEAALALATKLQNELTEGADFNEYAKKYSDGPSGKDGGSLGTFSRSDMVEPFANAAFVMTEGEISEPVETQFGYHIIRSDSTPTKGVDVAQYHELRIAGENSEAKATQLLDELTAGKITSTEEQAHVRYLFFSQLPSGWKDTELDGRNFRSATVTLDEYSRPVVQINFDDEGAKKFQALTGRNKGKRIAIFVGGEMVTAPTVNEEITAGTAIITGSQNIETARLLAQDLNTGAIPAPIYLNGQRTVEATLGAKSLRTSLEAALIGIIILMAYMIVVYRLLGLLADIALVGYALIFFAFLKLPLFLVSDQYIVLTLAGMAGVILSIGMAVDANVLIFERMKEELRKGKVLKTAVATGFERAWPSIRDGNVSTFITCAILFLIGTSIVRGFAITLGMGVALSMFSAIVVTRWLLKHIAASPLADRPELFGVRVKKE